MSPAGANWVMLAMAAFRPFWPFELAPLESETVSVIGEKVWGRKDVVPTGRYDDRVTFQIQARF